MRDGTFVTGDDVRLPYGDRLRDVSPVLVAHGTRNPHGVSVIAEIAEAVGRRIGVPARRSSTCWGRRRAR